MEAWHKALGQRTDGKWELLATAAGCAESVQHTMSGLTKQELLKGTNGLAIAPPVVAARVEAVAAWSIERLTNLVQDWPRPADVCGNSCATTAWRASLRHLAAAGLMRPDDFSSEIMPELAEEVDILWGQLPASETDWHSVLNVIKSRPYHEYAILRKLARANLVPPFPTNIDIARAPFVMLRLLRGKVSSLDSSAKSVIQSWCRSSIDTDLEATPLLAELCKTISPGTCDELRSLLIERLPRELKPDKYLELAYVLLGNWCIP